MDISYIVVMMILVVLSGYFSATETAFSSLNKIKIKVVEIFSTTFFLYFLKKDINRNL